MDSVKNIEIIIGITSPYNSFPRVVRKKNEPGENREKYRIVIDYHKLNKNTKDEKCLIPKYEGILDNLSGAMVFSTLDLKAGYHQTKMYPQDQHKTAFTFQRGH